MKTTPLRLPIVDHIAEQEQWIKDHGGDVLGYIARYGSMHDEKHYGNGGELIYKADSDQLQYLKNLSKIRKYL